MGFSRGGQAALYASLKRFHQLWNKSGVEFAGLHPVLSGLRHHLRRRHRHAPTGRSASSAAPPDDYNPIALCKAYAERLKAAGRDVQVTEYPNAPHSFDSPLGAQPAIVSPKSQSVRACKIREEAGGVLIERLDRPAVQLQGRLRGIRPAHRSRSGGDAAGPAGGDRVRADGVQAELNIERRRHDIRTPTVSPASSRRRAGVAAPCAGAGVSVASHHHGRAGAGRRRA